MAPDSKGRVGAIRSIGTVNTGVNAPAQPEPAVTPTPVQNNNIITPSSYSGGGYSYNQYGIPHQDQDNTLSKYLPWGILAIILLFIFKNK